MNQHIFGAVIFKGIEAPQKRPMGQNLGIRASWGISIFDWNRAELITTAYHQDLWGISANVNNIFGLFIVTHYFTNLHLQIFWQFELILHLTIICLFLSNPRLLRAYNIGILNYIFLSKIFLNNHVGVHECLLKSQRKVTGYCASIW